MALHESGGATREQIGGLAARHALGTTWKKFQERFFNGSCSPFAVETKRLAESQEGSFMVDAPLLKATSIGTLGLPSVVCPSPGALAKAGGAGVYAAGSSVSYLNAQHEEAGFGNGVRLVSQTSVMRYSKSVSTGIALLLSAFFGSNASGQDLEPRAYANTPVGMNFLVAGYAFSQGGVEADPSVPLEDAHVKIHASALGYVRSFNLLGCSSKVDLLLPYAWMSGEAIFAGEPRSRTVDGFGDPRIRLTVNFYGGPPLSLAEYSQYKGNLVIGASLSVSAPLGQYDSDKLLNVGANRWSFKPEIGASKSFGNFTLEVAAGVRVYTDNNEFLGGTLEQDPIYSGQGHLVYQFRPGLWLAVTGVLYGGGRTTVNGNEQDDLQENARIGLTLALPINKRNSLKIYAGKGVLTRTGSNFDTLGIAWQYRWGGGL